VCGGGGARARVRVRDTIKHIDFFHSVMIKKGHLFSNNQIFATLDECKCKQATRCRCYEKDDEKDEL